MTAEEHAYAVRVFGRGDFSLGAGEYLSATPPKADDEIDRRSNCGRVGVSSSADRRTGESDRKTEAFR